MCSARRSGSAGIPDESPVKDRQICAATAIQLFTLGIPCIYYGSEQAFAGPAHSQLGYLVAEGWNQSNNWADRYLREAMFGPEHPRADVHPAGRRTGPRTGESLPGFGPFGTAGRHAFDTPARATSASLAALCATRATHPALRIGRQYPRPTRLPDRDFTLPAAGELIAWSRILDVQEAVLVNPNGEQNRGGDVVVAAELSPPGSEYAVVANTAEVAAVAGGYHGTHPVAE